MDSCGLDRETGEPLTDFAHVEQSIAYILTTRLSSVVMLRQFGSGGPGILGRKLDSRTLVAFFALIAVAIETWEPRFRLTKVTPVGNTATTLQSGQFGFRLTGIYRPRALQGDLTPEAGTRQINL